MLDWVAPDGLPDTSSDDPPALLAAGLDDSKAQALLEALARHGVNCDAYLLTVETASDVAWSRAATYCAGIRRWGIRVCGRLAELAIVGAPIPATRGPPRRALLGVAEVRHPRRLPRDALTTWVMAPDDCTTVRILVPASNPACGAQAIARAERDLASLRHSVQVKVRPIHGGAYPRGALARRP